MNPIAAHVYDYHVGQIPASSVVDDEVRGVALVLLGELDSLDVVRVYVVPHIAAAR